MRFQGAHNSRDRIELNASAWPERFLLFRPSVDDTDGVLLHAPPHTAQWLTGSILA